MQRTRRVFLAVAVLLVADASASRSMVAQERCPAGVITELRFDIEKPLGSGSNDDGSAFDWVFRTMNLFHIRTREQTVRWELLFEEGDCFDPLILAESERSLRSLRYVSEAEITGEEIGVDAVRVHVRVRDSWALTGGLALSFDGGVAITGLSVNARNVFGTGTRLGLFRTVFRDRRRVGLIVRQPNLFGTRIDGTLHGGETRSGDYLSQSLFRPYAGEVGKNAFRQVARTRDDYFAYSVDPSTGYTQALLRFEEERYEVTAQRRWGGEDDLRLITGLTLSREQLRFPFGADGVALVVDNDFDEPVAALDEFRSSVSRHSVEHTADRVGITVGVRDLTFGSIMGLDALQAAQDVFTGGTMTLTVAPAVSTPDEVASDVFVRTRAAWGRRTSHTYLRLGGDLQTRRVGVDRAVTGRARDGWRDLVYEVSGSGYWLPSVGTRLFARVSYAAGYSLDRPFQLTLGGREGVRGYNDDAYPGARRLLATIEQRFPIPQVSTGWADVGLALFADAGRGWAGSIPFGEDSGWRAAAGAGLRFGLPAGASNVLRLDVGLPMTGERQTKGVLFRVYTELFGLLDRRSWPSQIARSRWYGVDPDLTTRPYNPLAGN